MLPLRTEEAHREIVRIYGEKPIPNNYFLITKDDGSFAVKHGWRAALGLIPLVGTRNSFGLLGTYLLYQGKTPSTNQCCGQTTIAPGRRQFLRTLFAGALVVSASTLGLSSHSLIRSSRGNAKSAQSNEGGGWQTLDPISLSDLLNEAMSSVDYANTSQALALRGLLVEPKLAQGFTRFTGGLEPLFLVIIPFGQDGFYTGYVMYKRQGSDTYATSYVRHVNTADPPGLVFLSASDKGTEVPPHEHRPQDRA